MLGAGPLVHVMLHTTTYHLRGGFLRMVASRVSRPMAPNVMPKLYIKKNTYIRYRKIRLLYPGGQLFAAGGGGGPRLRQRQTNPPKHENIQVSFFVQCVQRYEFDLFIVKI